MRSEVVVHKNDKNSVYYNITPGDVYAGAGIALKPVMSLQLKIHRCLLAICLVVLFATGAVADAELDEALVLAIINQARRSPAAMAESLGVEIGAFAGTLPALDKSPHLSASAIAHTRDMIDRQYYAEVGSDGRTSGERIAAMGYWAGSSGETLGMLAFLNYIDPAEAIRAIVENMFIDEIDPENKKPLAILNALYKDVGVGVGSGQWLIDGAVYNVYMVVCDFGVQQLSPEEQALRVLVNQARQAPLQVARAYGVDLQAVFQSAPDALAALRDGMPPVRFNPSLHEAALAHCEDMLANDYVSSVSLDGRRPKDRVVEAGYLPWAVGEAIRVIATAGAIQAGQALALNFERVFLKEIAPDYIQKSVLRAGFREAGLAILSAVPVDADGENLFDRYHVNMLVGDFAVAPLPTQAAMAEGWVFVDMDEDGLYDLGEGLGRTEVNVSDAAGKPVGEYFTDDAGAFSVPLTPGRYQIAVSYGAASTIRQLDIGITDAAVPIAFQKKEILVE